MKLLIVEDEPQLLKSLEDFASKEGYLYDSSKGFRSAAERIALYEYDCIVLDINLPDGNGAIVNLCKFQKKAPEHLGIDRVPGQIITRLGEPGFSIPTTGRVAGTMHCCI